MEEQQVAAAEQIVDHTSENVASSVNQKLRPVDNGKPEMLWRSDDCNHHPDDFCYICGYFITRTTTKHTLRKDTKLYEAYKQYFNIEVEHQDKQWVPHYACHNCTRRLHGWYQGENRLMEFAVPRIWHSPSNHQTDCYFCVVNLASGQKKSTYPDIPSSRAPIPHSAERPIPQRTCETAVSTTTISTVSGSSVPSSESLQLQGGVLNIPHYPNQTEINDLIRDLALPKNKSELLLSRLKQWSLLDESVRITSQRTRDEEFSSYYTSEDGICFCRDIEGLFSEIGIPLIVRDWRLFIDGSSKSLKVVLLHNRVKSEQYPSLPIAHSILLKESYATTKLLFNKIQYEKFGWEVIGDFKMIGFLIGLQGGYTKFPCFLCLWDSRDTENHYKIKNWEIRAQYKIGEKNVKNDPVVNMEKILMPPLHIKLGLIKQFVKALNKDSESFKFITKLFPKLSEAKITAGVFTGPQVKKLIKSESFPKLLNEKEKAAWKSFRDIVQGFLGNNRDPRYEAIVHELMKNFGVSNVTKGAHSSFSFG
ncbi:uncharacterized protein LOC115265503 [Aedes albopictus]|uniref:Uncharacterized protein n=1 Tax=Aedes albopictus TaxID=7160 RepID=A0ABM1ZTV8_AEDAL